ncbi:hypothetical protein GOOTI_036_00340 [Gordonia otitidis NBRC 100426]|uniref:Uncharacterized protein n=1 Tax=Gordonia otitidis (strain DSM 44809 / CCUG 52243 / JCM 12355 / NBRC 100426 / IFM 10032) TaxID=1108044 RepID=H5THR5_GORO1|nr:hypothetical protein GOOTI_036_00340 [Gordonia otitidis NBRC 100426]
MVYLSLAFAAVAVGAWVLSYHRSSQPRRSADLFVALSELNDSRADHQRHAAEVIEEKHHLEAHAGWPSAVIGLLSVMAVVFMVQDPSNTVSGDALVWMTSELLVIALISAAWTVWCVQRAARLAVRQAGLHR